MIGATDAASNFAKFTGYYPCLRKALWMPNLSVRFNQYGKAGCRLAADSASLENGTILSCGLPIPSLSPSGPAPVIMEAS